jgi:hypothetical protein
MKIKHVLSEAILFDDFHEIKVDPDRIDTFDLFDHLKPLIVKMAYKNLHSDKESHERKHGPRSDDEDAYNFEFTESALADEVEAIMNDLAGKLKTVSSKDVKAAIQAVSKEFKEPLEK